MTTPGFCRECAAGSGTAPHLCASIACPLIYCGLVRQLLKRWKFEGACELTGLLLSLSQHGPIPRPIASVEAIVPMPMHWLKKLHRGYNQAELLAAGIQQRWLPRTPIQRVLQTRWRASSQHHLGRALRGENARERFSCNRQIRGKRLLLVDDVLTTGATSQAAAAALLAAGASEVHLWCLARSP